VAVFVRTNTTPELGTFIYLSIFLPHATVVPFYRNQVESTGTQNEKYAKYAMEEA
jgi:hypothetical protein